MSFEPSLYEKAKQSSVIFDRNICAQVEVTGADHVQFLNQILSQDIVSMRFREWREAALLSATSHILAYMFSIKLAHSIILIGAPGATEKICMLLKKFHIAEDVQFTATRERWDFLELWGPDIAALIKKCANTQIFFFQPEGLSGQRTLLLSKASENIFQTARLIENETREILRIENGILEFGKDFDENIMLSETRLEKKSASETKGCYPGQEVVAKIETYKRLNRSFVRLIFSAGPTELPEAGTSIYSKSGEEVGRLTSRAYSPSLKKGVGLGWLKRGFFEQPVEVSIKSKTTISAFVSVINN